LTGRRWSPPKTLPRTSLNAAPVGCPAHRRGSASRSTVPEPSRRSMGRHGAGAGNISARAFDACSPRKRRFGAGLCWAAGARGCSSPLA
jgi:hypothetical protein